MKETLGNIPYGLNNRKYRVNDTLLTAHCTTRTRTRTSWDFDSYKRNNKSRFCIFFLRLSKTAAHQQDDGKHIKKKRRGGNTKSDKSNKNKNNGYEDCFNPTPTKQNRTEQKKKASAARFEHPVLALNTFN